MQLQIDRPPTQLMKLYYNKQYQASLTLASKMAWVQKLCVKWPGYVFQCMNRTSEYCNAMTM